MASTRSDAIAQHIDPDTHSPTTAIRVALSGPDNVGKTTQLRILDRRLGPRAQLAGPLDQFDPRWQQIKRDGLAAWWFETASMAELTDVLAYSYLERARHQSDAPLCLIDRGVPMLETSLASTAAVRESLDPLAAAERAQRLLAPFAADLERAEADEYAVTLLHHRDPESGTSRSLAREASVTDIYCAYQRHLHLQFQNLIKAGRFRQVIVTEDQSIIAVQALLRSNLSAAGVSVPPCRLDDVHVTALGGLSESGKSTAGEYLRVHHGYARLKIGYLIEEAAERCGITAPYAADPVTRAELLVDGLDRYCGAQHFIEHLSIESLHDHDATAHLRTLLGGNLTVVYLDVPADLRAERDVQSLEDLAVRDEVKRSRGAEHIGPLADRVIDNSGGRFALARQLDALALGRTWPRVNPRTAPVSHLGLPVHLESFLATLLDRAIAEETLVDLLAVTGSGARGKYQHGWSDLDVFAVAPATATPKLRTVLAEVAAELDGVKLGLTLVTAEECAAGAVPSRIVHVLAMIGNYQVLPLWCRPGFTLPRPDTHSDVGLSLRDGVQAAVEIRRQLVRNTIDVRALYKVAALAAKIMLRFEGVEDAADADALAHLLARHAPDRAKALCENARESLAGVEALAEAVIDAWMASMPTLSETA